MKADRFAHYHPLGHAGLTVATLLAVFPLFWMITTALTPNDLVLTKAFRFWPDDPSLANFRMAFAETPVGAWLVNSLVIAGLVTLGKLAIAFPAGFAFAHLRFPGRDWMFRVIIATMAFPVAISIVPLYVGVSLMGWYDTRAGVIIPSIAYVGFYVFFARQAFRILPGELFEAARLDRAGPFRQFFQIALPNVLPTVASLAVVSFMGAWNIYLWALLVLDSPQKRTLAIGLKAFTSLDDVEPLWGPMMAVALLSALPVLVLFAFAQRFIMAAFSGKVGA